MVVDDQRRTSEQNGIRPRAQVGEHQPGRVKRGDALAPGIVPRRLRLADHERRRRPAGRLQGSNEDCGRREAIRVEVTDDDDRAGVEEARNGIAHGGSRRGADIVNLREPSNHGTTNEVRCR